MINIFKGKWGFDSNLLIYILDKNSPYFKKTNQFVNLAKKLTDFYIAQQNIIEAERVFIDFYKLDEELVINKINDFLEVFNFSIISPLPSTIFRYHDLLKKYKTRDKFDLYLAATYKDNGINNFFTTNIRDFINIPNFKAVNPLRAF